MHEVMKDLVHQLTMKMAKDEDEALMHQIKHILLIERKIDLMDWYIEEQRLESTYTGTELTFRRRYNLRRNNDNKYWFDI